MNKKGMRTVIALVLGIIISIAGVAYPGVDVEARGKPQPASELVNFNLVGDELHFQLHLVNLNQAFSYNVTFERSGWDPVSDENLSPLGRVSRDYISPEIIRDISYGYPGTVQGHYGVQVELFDRKGTSLGVANATYECKFTVTFHETNLLPGVSIQLYSDAARTVPKGSALTTDTSGNATIVLEDGYVYWYTATKTDYVDFMGDISVHGHNLTVNFHMPLVYTVTFNVTNNVGDNLSDVYIDILKSNGGSWDYIGSVTTNTTGQATIDLLEGDEYYYYATKEGYNYLEDYFTVSGEPLTVPVTMYPYVNTVTFDEATDLEGVDIEVYSDAARTVWEGSCTTNATGQATIDLPDGTYYYKATLSPYADFLGYFTVSGAPLTESFDMVTSNILPLPFEEYFSESDVGGFPAGWTPSASYSFLMTVQDTNNAGGTSPELRFSYGPSDNPVTYSIYTPSINATGVTSTLNLSFKQVHYYYDEETPPVSPPYSIAVEVSTDGGTTWGSTSFAYSPTANIGPETVNVDLGAYKGYIINVRWSISGYTYWTDGWYIDDIIVSGS